MYVSSAELAAFRLRIAEDPSTPTEDVYRAGFVLADAYGRRIANRAYTPPPFGAYSEERREGIGAQDSDIHEDGPMLSRPVTVGEAWAALLARKGER